MFEFNGVEYEVWNNFDPSRLFVYRITTQPNRVAFVLVYDRFIAASTVMDFGNGNASENDVVNHLFRDVWNRINRSIRG